MRIALYITGLLISLISTSCREIFETSLESSSLEIYSPRDHDTTEIYTQSFWWEKVDGAHGYRLQVVSPSFAEMRTFVKDTLIKDDAYSITLAPGAYQWRMRAENSSSYTPYSLPRSLFIKKGDFGIQKITIISPENGAFFNSTKKEVTFKWEELPGAEYYVLQMDSTDLFGNVFTEDVYDTDFFYAFSKNNKYNWSIYGVDSTGKKSQTIRRTLTALPNLPDSVAKISPANNPINNANPILRWGESDNKHFAHYWLHVYTDAAGTTYLNSFPKKITSPTTTSHSLSEGTNNQRIYWRVEVEDKAGNVSRKDQIWGFTIQR